MSATSAQPVVLVTSGGTREPIDGVRFLTNFSTGRTGAAVADAFKAAGYDVIYLHAPDAHHPEAPDISKVVFTTVQSLSDALTKVLRDYDVAAVIHSAAVGDYRVDSLRIGDWSFKPLSDVKLPSDEPMTILLKPGPKLIDGIRKQLRNPSARIIGFKLTKNLPIEERQEAAFRLLERSSCDLVVSNDLSEISETMHVANLYGKNGKIAESKTKPELGKALVAFVKGALK